jgi:hypothetical protein
MTNSDPQILDGRIILIRQTDPPFPGTPVTMRGLLRVSADPATDSPLVTIALSFPSVFTSPPEELALPLSEDEVSALLAQPGDGTYEYTVRGSLDDLRTRVRVAKILPAR